MFGAYAFGWPYFGEENSLVAQAGRGAAEGESFPAASLECDSLALALLEQAAAAASDGAARYVPGASSGSRSAPAAVPDSRSLAGSSGRTRALGASGGELRDERA